MRSLPRGLPRRSPVNRLKATRRPPYTHAPLLVAIEFLEPRAMLAGLGPESWNAAGPAPAPLGTGALSSSGIILTCSSPAPHSSGTTSTPTPNTGSGVTTSVGDLWLSCSAESGGGGSTSGSTGGVNTNGPALSSQVTGGTGGGRTGPAAVSGTGRLPFVLYDALQTAPSGGRSQSGSTGSTSLTLADGQSTVTITPLVYQTGSDDGPGVVTAVWTGDDGGWQVILMSDGEHSYGDGAPDGEPRGDPRPLRLPGVTGFSQFTSMGEPGWGDDVPVFRLGDVEAARGLTGLAKMVHDHGAPISSRDVDSAGRVIRYTFADGSSYMEPVEPPSEQYIDSAAAMIPGGIALKSGKGVFVASGAVMTEVIEDTITNRASETASQATGGYVSFFPPGVLAALLSGKLKPRAPDADGVGEVIEGTARETGEIAHHSSQSAARRAARREAGMGKNGGVEQLPDQPLRPGSQAPTGPRGTRTEVQSTDTGDIVHHDPYGTRYQDGSVTPPHYGVDRDGQPTIHHTYPSPHDPRTNR